MKRLFSFCTVLASAAILFSCGGSSSSSNNTPPELSGESLAITKAAGKAVSGAISSALNSINGSPARKAAAFKAEGAINYANNDKTLVVTGTRESMAVTMDEYKSESDGHKLVLTGTINVVTTEAEGTKTETFKGSIELTYDGAAHTIEQDYKTVTDYEKKTYTTTGTVTFDGTESSYTDSGDAVDPNAELGALKTISNSIIDEVGKNSQLAFKGSISSSDTFSFGTPTVSDDTRTLTPKAANLAITLPDKTALTFTSANITVAEKKPLTTPGNPVITTYTLSIKSGTAKSGSAEYTFECSGTRTETLEVSATSPKVVEKYNVTINGKTFPLESSF